MFPPLCQILKTLCFSPVCCSEYKGMMQTNVTAALGYIAAGIMSVFAGRWPSLFLVGFAVFVNIVATVFAIIGIVLYAIDLGNVSIIWMCDRNRHNADNHGDNCRYLAFFAQSLLTGMDITLIVLAVLQLCVCISFSVLALKALVNRKKEEI
ncbi:uncharacterized protein LOC121186287 isoform X2 [Toxotes jaculatrix]|uniref:uncharacterized protein LOC121186287 isoform X2 n=1 Tax=Toxotes jaculatrix TaxID=941984 RepID=UPI001B3B16DF|nr:uncharacterized protein LOC121186287 isoform X2 [Toxotes jaculatrix]